MLYYNHMLLYIVCGRTYQDTRATFGSPQHANYTGSPGFVSRAFRMVSAKKCMFKEGFHHNFYKQYAKKGPA